REKLTSLNGQLLETYALNRWAELPHDELYLWGHLDYHLRESERKDEFLAVVMDLRYLATKTFVLNANSCEDDLAVAEEQWPEDRTLHLLRRTFTNILHLLSRGDTLNDI